ncbi:MAG: type IV toxin-antitoxin system AbiEi family antitoxin domain-containing protein, partial [Acidimicrobiales bacterium]
MDRKADAGIARLARRQHGVWNRRQALAAGMNRRMITARTASATWLAVDHGVYTHVTSTPTWERSVMAAVLAEPWAVASHQSAAVLHQLLGFRQGRPVITIRPGANARGQLAIAHRGIDTRTTVVRGIPAVTLDQVFIDLAQVVSEPRLR